MAKCLRCGAGNEWIQGRVKDEPLSSHAVLDEGWRDATEKVPKLGQLVLGYHKADKIRIYTYYQGGFGNPIIGEYRGPVTHWRPLPDPPAFV